VVGTAVSNIYSSNSINNNTISSNKVGAAMVPSPPLLLSLCSLPVSLCLKVSCFSLNLLLILIFHRCVLLQHKQTQQKQQQQQQQQQQRNKSTNESLCYRSLLISLVAGASLLVDFAAVMYFLLTAAAIRLSGVSTIVFSRSVGGSGGEAEWATAVARLSRSRRVCFQLPMARLSVRQHFLLLSTSSEAECEAPYLCLAMGGEAECAAPCLLFATCGLSVRRLICF
jgi:hypothetical protein